MASGRGVCVYITSEFVVYSCLCGGGELHTCVYLFMRVCVCVCSTYKHTQTSGYPHTRTHTLHCAAYKSFKSFTDNNTTKKTHNPHDKKNTHLINPNSNEGNIPACTNISALFSLADNRAGVIRVGSVQRVKVRRGHFLSGQRGEAPEAGN